MLDVTSQLKSCDGAGVNRRSNICVDDVSVRISDYLIINTDDIDKCGEFPICVLFT